jgi:hypothetical protein
VVFLSRRQGRDQQPDERHLNLYLKNRAREKACAIALHPGAVKTGLSKEH